MEKSLGKNIKRDVKAGVRFGLLIFGFSLAIDMVAWAFGEFDKDSPEPTKPTGSE